MEAPLKQRLIGAVVLAALALIFVPMLLKSPDVKDPDSADVPLSIPDEPDDDGITTIDIPLDAPAEPAKAPTVAASVPQTAVTAAAAPDAAAPVDAGPAQAAGQYALVLPAVDDAGAKTLLAAVRKAGLNGVVQGNGQRFRVRVGPFNARESAEQARLRLAAAAPGGLVVAMDAAVASTAESNPAAPAVKPALPAAMPTQAVPVAAKPAETKPMPAPAKSEPMSAAKGFAVQIGAPASEQAAIGLRDKARAAGFTSFIQPVDTESGRRYRVRIGPEASRESAAALLARVKQNTGIDGIVVAHP